MVLTHFIVSDDVERSRRFYTEVLGGQVAFPGNPVNVALANSWIVINSGGGPTDDKPTVTLETHRPRLQEPADHPVTGRDLKPPPCHRPGTNRPNVR
jgi:catechol 2,3-dioxygenase-like lactoylglutathione lyase family enzyme